MRALLVLACLSAVTAAAPPLVTITAARLSSQPLLGPQSEWTSLSLFNPAAVRYRDKVVLLFRAQDARRVSRIGYAESKDGRRFTVRPEPVLSPEAPYEKGGGVEDPRVVNIRGLYYMTYTGYDGHSAQLCLATSSDLLHWDRKGVIMPAYKGTWNTQWTKSGAILTEQVNGKWWMYYMGSRTDKDGKQRDYMGLAKSNDLLQWQDATSQPVLSRLPGRFDERVMEPGPPPLMTSAGILLLYNGADDKLVYGPGWLLFDRRDPTRLLARSEKPFVSPQYEWEKSGTVPNVIFLEGLVPEGDSFLGYYGAADKYIGGLRIRITTQ